jgi:hypothetical protein
VHGFTDEPTLNPYYLSRITRFIKKLFPVRYIPTTETTPIGAGTALRSSTAKLLSWYSNSKNYYFSQDQNIIIA